MDRTTAIYNLVHCMDDYVQNIAQLDAKTAAKSANILLNSLLVLCSKEEIDAAFRHVIRTKDNTKT